MTDRDDALRKELGWPGPDEAAVEPPAPGLPEPEPRGSFREQPARFGPPPDSVRAVTENGSVPCVLPRVIGAIAGSGLPTA